MARPALGRERACGRGQDRGDQAVRCRARGDRHHRAEQGGDVPDDAKRANWSLRKLKTYLGRVIRDIKRKTAGNQPLRKRFARLLTLPSARAGARVRQARLRSSRTIRAPWRPGRGRATRARRKLNAPQRHAEGARRAANARTARSSVTAMRISSGRAWAIFKGRPPAPHGHMGCAQG